MNVIYSHRAALNQRVAEQEVSILPRSTLVVVSDQFALCDIQYTRASILYGRICMYLQAHREAHILGVNFKSPEN